MKKIFCILTLFFCFVMYSFCEELETELYFLISQDDMVYASYGEFINIFPAENDADTVILKEELKKPFNIEWTDKNFPKDRRKMLSSLLSPILSTLLPSEKIIFSTPIIGMDNSKSFRIKNLANGNIYSMVMKDGKIISMSFEKNDKVYMQESEEVNDDIQESDEVSGDEKESDDVSSDEAENDEVSGDEEESDES